MLNNCNARVQSNKYATVPRIDLCAMLCGAGEERWWNEQGTWRLLPLLSPVTCTYYHYYSCMPEFTSSLKADTSAQTTYTISCSYHRYKLNTHGYPYSVNVYTNSKPIQSWIRHVYMQIPASSIDIRIIPSSRSQPGTPSAKASNFQIDPAKPTLRESFPRIENEGVRRQSRVREREREREREIWRRACHRSFHTAASAERLQGKGREKASFSLPPLLSSPSFILTLAHTEYSIFIISLSDEIIYLVLSIYSKGERITTSRFPVVPSVCLRAAPIVSLVCFFSEKGRQLSIFYFVSCPLCVNDLRRIHWSLNELSSEIEKNYLTNISIPSSIESVRK